MRGRFSLFAFVHSWVVARIKSKKKSTFIFMKPQRGLFSRVGHSSFRLSLVTVRKHFKSSLGLASRVVVSCSAVTSKSPFWLSRPWNRHRRRAGGGTKGTVR